MADDADRAGELIEQDLARRIAAAREQPYRARYALHCDTCHRALADARKPMGRCVRCQAQREASQRHFAVGV